MDQHGDLSNRNGMTLSSAKYKGNSKNFCYTLGAHRLEMNEEKHGLSIPLGSRGLCAASVR